MMTVAQPSIPYYVFTQQNIHTLADELFVLVLRVYWIRRFPLPPESSPPPPVGLFKWKEGKGGGSGGSPASEQIRGIGLGLMEEPIASLLTVWKLLPKDSMVPLSTYC